MFFPEITGNECMKFLQNVIFTTDLFLITVFSGKKICYIQKQRIARCLYTPEKEMMFNIHQMHQYFQLLMDDLSLHTLSTESYIAYSASWLPTGLP